MSLEKKLEIKPWEVVMYPHELEFVDFVLSKKTNQNDSLGDYIPIIRGGVIYLDDYRSMTENQMKWLLFVKLQKVKYQVPGFVGLKISTGNWNGIIPQVVVNEEALTKFRVSRITTCGMPLDDNTGFPIRKFIKEKVIHENYAWNNEVNDYQLVSTEVRSSTNITDTGYTLGSFLSSDSELGE